MTTLARLAWAIESAWSIDTTWTPDEYVGRHPSTGQCAVSSLLLAEMLPGAVLMRGWAIEPGRWPERHFWIEVGSMRIDITWAQFAPGATLIQAEPVTATEAIENEWMCERLDNLRQRVKQALAGMIFQRRKEEATC